MFLAAIMHGLACWFDIEFQGTTQTVVLSTSPEAPGTHWYQCRLMLREPVAVNRTQTVSGNLHFEANTSFSYTISFSGEKAGGPSSNHPSADEGEKWVGGRRAGGGFLVAHGYAWLSLSRQFN